MIKLCLSLVSVILFISFGVYGWQKHLLKQNSIYIKEQEKKLEELRKTILSQKQTKQKECFEKTLYNRKRFLEESIDEKVFDDFDSNSSLIIF